MMARRIEHRSRDELSKNTSTLLALEERRAKAPPAVLSLREVELLNTGNKTENISKNNKLPKNGKKVENTTSKNDVDVVVVDADGVEGSHDEEDASVSGEKRKRDCEPLPQGWPEDGYYVCEEDDRCIDIAKRFNVDLERVRCIYVCVCVRACACGYVFEKNDWCLFVCMCVYMYIYI
jgi:hypothetical protein